MSGIKSGYKIIKLIKQYNLIDDITTYIYTYMMYGLKYYLA